MTIKPVQRLALGDRRDDEFTVADIHTLAQAADLLAQAAVRMANAPTFGAQGPQVVATILAAAEDCAIQARRILRVGPEYAKQDSKDGE